MTKYQILSNNGYHYDYFIRLGDISIQDHIYLFNITYFMQISIQMHIEIVRL